MAVDEALALGSKVRRTWQLFLSESVADRDDLFEGTVYIPEG